jgi:hypothetical protein
MHKASRTETSFGRRRENLPSTVDASDKPRSSLKRFYSLLQSAGYRGMRASLAVKSRRSNAAAVTAFQLFLLAAGPTVAVVWAIKSEQPGVADVFGEVDANCSTGWCGYFTDPNKTFLSYAVVAVGTSSGGLCSGAFIGPNLLITASHCGGPTATPTSITYLGTAAARAGSQTVSQWSPGLGTCSMLLGAIQQNAPPVWYRGAADVQLFYCPDVSVRGQQVPPGLLLGMLDFDLRQVGVNEPVYELWWNQITDRNLQSHLLISQGVITGTTSTYGFQNTPTYSTNICVNGGASGGPTMSAKWHRILIGPLALGGRLYDRDLPCTVGTQAAQAHSIFEKFYLDPSLYPVQISANTISTLLRLPPALYAGWQDRDANYVLDIQEDYERTRGEINRDQYWYNFESRHQNALWRTFGSSVIYPDQLAPTGLPYGIAHLEAAPAALPAPGPGQPVPLSGETLLRDDTFPLLPDTTYRVSFTLLRVDSAASTQALQFSGASIAPQTIQTSVSQNPVPVIFRFTTGQTTVPGIRFDATAPIRADIEFLSIIQEGSVMDFDTVDKREPWRNQTTSGHALILPDGVTAGSGAVPDFALALTSNNASGAQCLAQCERDEAACVPDCEAERDLCQQRGGLPASECEPAFLRCKKGCAPQLAACREKCRISEDWSAVDEHLALVPGDSYKICFKKKASAGTLKGRSETVNATRAVLSRVAFSANSSNWDDACLPVFTAQPGTKLRYGLQTSGREHILIDNITITRN